MEDLHISKKSLLCDLVKLCNEERGINYLIWSSTTFQEHIKTSQYPYCCFWRSQKQSMAYCQKIEILSTKDCIINFFKHSGIQYGVFNPYVRTGWTSNLLENTALNSEKQLLFSNFQMRSKEVTETAAETYFFIKICYFWWFPRELQV